MKKFMLWAFGLGPAFNLKSIRMPKLANKQFDELRHWIQRFFIVFFQFEFWTTQKFRKYEITIVCVDVERKSIRLCFFRRRTIKSAGKPNINSSQPQKFKSLVCFWEIPCWLAESFNSYEPVTSEKTKRRKQILRFLCWNLAWECRTISTMKYQK